MYVLSQLHIHVCMWDIVEISSLRVSYIVAYRIQRYTAQIEYVFSSVSKK